MIKDIKKGTRLKAQIESGFFVLCSVMLAVCF
jgi:hypothetical protein